jgi:hypothetical protein
VQATTARNAAIGCFALAGVLGILSVTDAFKSTPKPPPPPPQCQYLPLPKREETIWPGDWCYRLNQGQTFHFTTTYAFDIGFSGLKELRLDVFDPNGEKFQHETRTIREGPGGCVQLPKRWGRAEITAMEGSGVIRVRSVGKYPDRIHDCW